MASINELRVLQLSSFSMRNSFLEKTQNRYIKPSAPSLQSDLVYGARLDKMATIDLYIGFSNLGPFLMRPYTLTNTRSAYVQHLILLPVSFQFAPCRSTKSSCMLKLKGEFKFMASSLDADIFNKRNMVRYIKLLLVGSFLLWSIRIITPRSIT